MDQRSRRIAKNTLMLYVRTFFTMIVSFWTSRLMLEALGIDNYGIKNVVGSIVGFSGLLTGAMSAAGSRFITYAIGKGDLDELRGVFCSSFHVQLILSILIFIVLEIAGVWFLNTEANIPEGRMYAANFVLQAAIVSLLFSILSVPYNSLIIAHERMSIYAYMSIIDVSLQLGIVYLILRSSSDRLILLSILQLICSLGLTTFYALYSRFNFHEARISFEINWKRIKVMCAFSGWNYIGNATWIFNTQGLNMLVNVFFGVAFNAARGIASTVNGCVQSFVTNFSMAFTPQITKSYASGNVDYCYRLVNRAAKITSMLQIIFMIPVFMEANTLLKIWLTEVPPMSAIFLRFALIESFALSLSGSLLKLIQANGNIKKVTLETSFFSCLVFPLTWIAFKFGMPVWASYPIMIFFYLIILGIYLYESTRLTSYEWRPYIYEVLKPSIKVIFFSLIPLVFIYLFIDQSLMRFFILVPISVLWTAFCIYKWGLDNSERQFVYAKFEGLKSKYFNLKLHR